jgi:hypothetical protein
VLEPGFQPGRTEQPTTRGNGSPTRATANHESFDTLEGSKPSWMAVALVEPPFPLVVGCSVWPGWKPGSNTAASASGICAARENRQLLVHWRWSFGCLSSFGISRISMVFSRCSQHPLPGADPCGLSHRLPKGTPFDGL